MQIDTFALQGLLLFTPRRFADARGYFMETFRASTFRDTVGATAPDFVQDNQSLSLQRGTVRGLHYQSPPHAQGKLVRCTRGRITDVAVDARRASPTFGQHVAVELSDDNAAQLWVPAGFLHGFATLEDDTVVQYKCTDYYAAECDGAVAWDDPALGIDWGIAPAHAVVSPKDAAAPRFADFDTPF